MKSGLGFERAACPYCGEADGICVHTILVYDADDEQAYACDQLQPFEPCLHTIAEALATWHVSSGTLPIDHLSPAMCDLWLATCRAAQEYLAETDGPATKRDLEFLADGLACSFAPELASYVLRLLRTVLNTESRVGEFHMPGLVEGWGAVVWARDPGEAVASLDGMILRDCEAMLGVRREVGRRAVPEGSSTAGD